LTLGAILVLFGVLGGTQSSSADSPTSLTIASEIFPPFSTRDLTGFEDLLAIEMYRRIGIEIDIARLPSERVLANANEGIDDGTHSRVGGMAEKFGNLVQIDESVLSRDYVAFSRHTDIEIADWGSLKPYNVAIINGWKILEWNIKGTKSLAKVKTTEQLFKMLESGRVDIIVYARWAGLHTVRELRLEGVRDLEAPLATRDVYWYLHKKHEALVPQAEAALREMKRDGTYQRIFEQTLGRLAAN
jgi:polar amino acid transport system substrate-binding protein